MFDVIFIDSGREPRCKPDPAYPDGKHVDMRQSAIQKYCSRNLPYPAPRCGAYAVKCTRCGKTAALTVAGRADDPKVLTMPCGTRGLDG